MCKPLGVILYSNPEYEKFFGEHLDLSRNMKHIPLADIVIFTGGPDISPDLYKHYASTYAGIPDKNRDLREEWAFKQAAELDIPMIGICRGAQLICTMNGGSLYQHVEGHARGNALHEVQMNDGALIYVTSTHHQMMYPWDINHKILAWTKPKSNLYVWNPPMEKVDATVNPPKIDPECVYFPDTMSLGVQWHPEKMSNNSAASAWVARRMMELIDTGSIKQAE